MLPSLVLCRRVIVALMYPHDPCATVMVVFGLPVCGDLLHKIVLFS